MKLKLIDDWKQAYKKASIQLAAFVAVLSGIITVNQGLLMSLFAYMPNGALRYVLAGVVMSIVFIIPALSRVVQKAPNGGQPTP